MKSALLKRKTKTAIEKCRAGSGKTICSQIKPGLIFPPLKTLPMNYRTRKRPAKSEKFHEEPVPYRVNGNHPPRQLHCIDLFSGCGGLSLGLEEAGFKPLLFSEINPQAAETYIANRTGMDIVPVGDWQNDSRKPWDDVTEPWNGVRKPWEEVTEQKNEVRKPENGVRKPKLRAGKPGKDFGKPKTGVRKPPKDLPERKKAERLSSANSPNPCPDKLSTRPTIPFRFKLRKVKPNFPANGQLFLAAENGQRRGGRRWSGQLRDQAVSTLFVPKVRRSLLSR